jgi:hypothetical protein
MSLSPDLGGRRRLPAQAGGERFRGVTDDHDDAYVAALLERGGMARIVQTAAGPVLVGPDGAPWRDLTPVRTMSVRLGAVLARQGLTVAAARMLSDGQLLHFAGMTRSALAELRGLGRGD